ncbi:hypothetical protein AFA91_13815 [Mycolicibacterium goodii]|uniref:Uncharacterized protein n=1 Tax=Mycolicibacterium goodii TaxID=134601 RepID=A0A0K0X5V9_MYCGD|nr:hypothetical protein AFA91_13815 [Mycolicibacterium goodii]
MTRASTPQPDVVLRPGDERMPSIDMLDTFLRAAGTARPEGRRSTGVGEIGIAARSDDHQLSGSRVR